MRGQRGRGGVGISPLDFQIELCCQIGDKGWGREVRRRYGEKRGSGGPVAESHSPRRNRGGGRGGKWVIRDGIAVGMVQRRRDGRSGRIFEHGGHDHGRRDVAGLGLKIRA